GRLRAQPLSGQFPQFVVDERQQLLGGVRVALVDGIQHLGDRVHCQSTPSRTGRPSASAWRDGSEGCGLAWPTAPRLPTASLRLPVTKAPRSAHVMSTGSEDGSGEGEGTRDEEQGLIVAAGGCKGER